MLAMKIFKPDVESFKEKDCMTKPTYVVADVIEIPRELIAAQEDMDIYSQVFHQIFAIIVYNIQKYKSFNF